MLKQVCIAILGVMALSARTSLAEPKSEAKLASQSIQLTAFNAANPCSGRKYRNTFKLAGTGKHSYRHIGYGMVYGGGNQQVGSITLTAGQEGELTTYWTFNNGSKDGKDVYVSISIDNGPVQRLATKRDTCATQMP